jgi:hypothetical protein
VKYSGARDSDSYARHYDCEWALLLQRNVFGIALLVEAASPLRSLEATTLIWFASLTAIGAGT